MSPLWEYHSDTIKLRCAVRIMEAKERHIKDMKDNTMCAPTILGTDETPILNEIARYNGCADYNEPEPPTE